MADDTKQQPGTSRDAEFFNDQGEELLRSRQTEKALVYFSRAIELNKEFAEAYQNRAGIYSALGRNAEALADYKLAALHEIKPPPELRELEENKGRGVAADTEVEDIIGDFTLATAYNERGEKHLEKNLPGRAERDFSKAIRHNPNFAAPYRNRGSIHLQANRFDQAASDFSALIELEPENPEAPYLRGLAHSGNGKFPEAVNDFTRTLELDPDCGDAYLKRGEAYGRLGREKKAAADMNKALSLGSVQGSSDKIRDRYTDEIDDVLSDLFPDTDTPEDILADLEATPSPAVLEFLNHGKEEVARVTLFAPAAEEITVQSTAAGPERIMQLSELACIRLTAKPPQLVTAGGEVLPERIQLADDSIRHVRVPSEQPGIVGIFAFSAKDFTRHRYYFFPRNNIRLRCLTRHLGEILLDKGMIGREQLHHALSMQERQKKKKLGKIIAEQTNILNEIVEQEIERVYKQNREENQPRVGDILLSTGLVDADQVNAALAVQDNLRRKRIGEYLLEKGLLKEEDLFIALAEKFRIPYVDLRQVSIPRKALHILPLTHAVKLKVLPISFRQSDLVVATMEPDAPELRDRLRTITRRPVQLVLARSTLLRIALRKIAKLAGERQKKG